MADMTPATRFAFLERKLDQQQREIAQPEGYYDGRHRLAFASEKFREAYGSTLNALCVNWCPLVVDALAERLRVEGFRFGGADGDREAWEIWQESDMDAGARMIHTEALKCGVAYALVEPGADGELPTIYPEHPSQMVVAHAAGRRRERVAALKKWEDDDGYLMATLYLPDWIYKFRSQQKGTVTAGGRVNWRERVEPVPNQLGVVPVVPYYNKPTMLAGGQSELKDAIPIQDAINKLVGDMIIDSETIAFQQRVILGWEVPKDEQGNPLPGTELRAIRSKVWAFRDPNVTVQQLPGASLDGYVKPIGMLIQHFSAITRMPPHYLLGQMINAAGDALIAAEGGLVNKAEGRQTDFADPHEDVLRIAFRAMGRPLARRSDAETVWGNPQIENLAVRADAATKMHTAGVPLETIWQTVLGFTPQQIDRMKTLAGLPERPAPGAPTTTGGVVLPAGATA